MHSSSLCTTSAGTRPVGALGAPEGTTRLRAMFVFGFDRSLLCTERMEGALMDFNAENKRVGRAVVMETIEEDNLRIINQTSVIWLYMFIYIHSLNNLLVS